MSKSMGSLLGKVMEILGTVLNISGNSCCTLEGHSVLIKARILINLHYYLMILVLLIAQAMKKLKKEDW